MGWITFCVALGIVFWYVSYRLTLNLNAFCPPPTLVALKEDLLWILPGAGKRRASYIKELVKEGDGYMISSKGSWSYQEIRDNNLYEEVGWAMLPGYFSFFLNHVYMPLLPLLIYYIFTCCYSK